MDEYRYWALPAPVPREWANGLPPQPHPPSPPLAPANPQPLAGPAQPGLGRPASVPGQPLRDATPGAAPRRRGRDKGKGRAVSPEEGEEPRTHLQEWKELFDETSGSQDGPGMSADRRRELSAASVDELPRFDLEQARKGMVEELQEWNSSCRDVLGALFDDEDDVGDLARPPFPLREANPLDLGDNTKAPRKKANAVRAALLIRRSNASTRYVGNKARFKAELARNVRLGRSFIEEKYKLKPDEYTLDVFFYAGKAKQQMWRWGYSMQGLVPVQIQGRVYVHQAHLYHIHIRISALAQGFELAPAPPSATTSPSPALSPSQSPSSTPASDDESAPRKTARKPEGKVPAVPAKPTPTKPDYRPDSHFHYFIAAEDGDDPFEVISLSLPEYLSAAAYQRGGPEPASADAKRLCACINDVQSSRKSLGKGVKDAWKQTKAAGGGRGAFALVGGSRNAGISGHSRKSKGHALAFAPATATLDPVAHRKRATRFLRDADADELKGLTEEELAYFETECERKLQTFDPLHAYVVHPNIDTGVRGRPDFDLLYSCSLNGCCFVGPLELVVKHRTSRSCPGWNRFKDTFVGELDVPHRRAFFVREVKTDQWMCFEAPETCAHVLTSKTGRQAHHHLHRDNKCTPNGQEQFKYANSAIWVSNGGKGKPVVLAPPPGYKAATAARQAEIDSGALQPKFPHKQGKVLRPSNAGLSDNEMADAEEEEEEEEEEEQEDEEEEEKEEEGRANEEDRALASEEEDGSASEGGDDAEEDEVLAFVQSYLDEE